MFFVQGQESISVLKKERYLGLVCESNYPPEGSKKKKGLFWSY